MDDLVKTALQGVLAGGGLGGFAVLFGIWDRRMQARKSSTEAARGLDQDTMAERKQASEYLRTALQEARQDAEICRRDLTAERDASRTKDIRLAEKRERIASLDRSLRAMDNAAHWFRHEAAALVQKAYSAGWLHMPMPAEARGLPPVPRIEDVADWQPPPHSYATTAEIAATFQPPPQD